ncbi:hypothetical protein ACFW1A_00725 [Kitasatospora sp. NPDC058965]|uniref:hypothetical protein n=1 Tax=Kitasatospora sp. NPDC058965 TaxID=3346682 RepID=UPI003691B006
MPAPTALVLLAVLLLIAAAARLLMRRHEPEPDVYELEARLGPADSAEPDDVFEPIYLPSTPSADRAEEARALQVEADAAEARLAVLLRNLDQLLGTDSTTTSQRAPVRVPATASARKEPTAS